MAEQKVDTEALNDLVKALGELEQYCTALQQGASGFAYMLPAEWQGPAMSNFLSMFEKWNLGATGMTTAAGALRTQVSDALKAYNTTISELDSTWDSISASLS